MDISFTDKRRRTLSRAGYEYPVRVINEMNTTRKNQVRRHAVFTGGFRGVHRADWTRVPDNLRRGMILSFRWLKSVSVPDEGAGLGQWKDPSAEGCVE
jgi:hypothetical protein